MRANQAYSVIHLSARVVRACPPEGEIFQTALFPRRRSLTLHDRIPASLPARSATRARGHPRMGYSDWRRGLSLWPVSRGHRAAAAMPDRHHPDGSTHFHSCQTTRWSVAVPPTRGASRVGIMILIRHPLYRQVATRIDPRVGQGDHPGRRVEGGGKAERVHIAKEFRRWLLAVRHEHGAKPQNMWTGGGPIGRVGQRNSPERLFRAYPSAFIPPQTISAIRGDVTPWTLAVTPLRYRLTTAAAMTIRRPRA